MNREGQGREIEMEDYIYRAILDLLMCSDPYPVPDDGVGQEILIALANDEAKKRGYGDWVVAYHEFEG